MTLLRRLPLIAALIALGPAALSQSIAVDAPAPQPTTMPDVRGLILHEQVDGSQTTGIISQFNETATQFDTELADDFMVPDGESWSITSMYVRGFFSTPVQGVPSDLTVCPDAFVFVWEDNGGKPGDLLAEREVEPEGEGGEMFANFDSIVVGPGHHWIGFTCYGPGLDSGIEDRWNWFVNSTATFFEPAHIRNENGGFNLGDDWVSFAALNFGPDLDWFISGSIESVSSEGGAQPMVFSLLQNFPNPALGATDVQFVLDEAADITVTVFDALGRRVIDAFSGSLSAGQQTVTVDVSGLPTGTYFYRVQAGDQMMVRKMTVVN